MMTIIVITVKLPISPTFTLEPIKKEPISLIISWKGSSIIIMINKYKKTH